MSKIDEDQMKIVLDRLDNLEARVSSIEKSIATVEKKPTVKKEFTGLVGGLRKLYYEGFFDTLKSLKQILDEMKRQGYYYSAPAVNTTLTRYLMKKWGLVTRVGKRGQWEYVKKK